MVDRAGYDVIPAKQPDPRSPGKEIGSGPVGRLGSVPGGGLGATPPRHGFRDYPPTMAIR